MKINFKTFFTLVFATFLLFATVETLSGNSGNPATAVENNREETLEVPKTGLKTQKSVSETYEALIEIAFLALTGAVFYVLNEKRSRKT